MDKYLLLRDNKQSGPYSVEELIKKGLKPYDLVWLDGKSAAWRYPSEIAEFKAVAPAVEEQPYDRFYKKKPIPQTVSSTTYETITTHDTVTAEHIVVTKPVTATTTTPAITAKKIYVTLPAGVKDRPQTTTHTAVQTQTAPVKDANQDTGEQEAANASLLNEKFARLREEKMKQAGIMAATPVVSNKTATDTTATRGFSEIVEKNHPRQEEKLATMVMTPRGNNNRLLMRSIVAACLILCGVIIGLVISNSRQQKSNEALDLLVKQIQERDKRLTAANQVAPSTVQEPATTPEDHTAGPAGDQPATASTQATTRPASEGAAIRKNTGPVQKEDPPTTEEPSLKVIPAVVTNKPEEKPVNRQELEQARRNIHQLVAVDANKYKTGVLGGISNLVLTVSNNSLYPLDRVEVEVRYLGPEKRVVKTQMLVFNDVAAGEQKTVEAPRTNRGVTVDYLITRINSKALDLAHAGN